MIQRTLVKSNDFVVEVQEDLISGIVSVYIHARTAPGTNVYDYVIANKTQDVLQARPDRTNDRLAGIVRKDIKRN